MNYNATGSAAESSVAAGHLTKEKEYWLAKLSGDPEKSVFLYDYRDSVPAVENSRYSFTVPAALAASLERLRNGSDNRLHMILTAALVLLLHKYSHDGDCDIMIGAPVVKQETDRKFINTALVLRTMLRPDMSFKELLLAVRKTIVEATQHQNYPLEVLAGQLGMEPDTVGGSDNSFPLFDVVSMLENIHRESDILGFNPGIVFSFCRSGEGVKGVILYNPARYSAVTVSRIVDHFLEVLRNALGSVNQPLSRIEVMSAVEKRRLLEEFNPAPVPYAGGKTLHGLFAEQAEKFPDDTALAVTNLSDADPVEDSAFITFRELDLRSSRLAAGLIRKGVGPGSIVVVMIDRSIELIVSILAVLKTGSAYLPVDINYPAERISYMLRDSGSCFAVFTRRRQEDVERLKSMGAHHDIQFIRFETAGNVDHIDSTGMTEEGSDFAYVIYTSGSTGRPKGVPVRHRGLVNLVECKLKMYSQGRFSRVTQVTGPAFDAMAYEIWPALLNGAALHIVPEAIRIDPAALMQWLIEKRITATFQSTAVAFRLLLRDWPQNGVALKFLTIAGDRLPALPDREYPFRIFNLYGVTEASVWSTSSEILPGRDPHSPPAIGMPIPNHHVFILNASGDLQPMGAAGEICIQSDALAAGYLNRPQLTSEKFVKLYKTGDLGKWNADGQLHFLGRIDFQVKIRGFRIEPGEIEKPSPVTP